MLNNKQESLLFELFLLFFISDSHEHFLQSGIANPPLLNSHFEVLTILINSFILLFQQKNKIS